MLGAGQMEDRITVLQLNQIDLPSVVPEVAVDDFIQVDVAHCPHTNLLGLLKL